jgi:hypothetical protein
MIAVSSQCLSIAIAIGAGTIRTTERVSRFGVTYVAIEDAHGIIECCEDQAEADRRINAIRERNSQ